MLDSSLSMPRWSMSIVEWSRPGAVPNVCGAGRLLLAPKVDRVGAGF